MYCNHPSDPCEVDLWNGHAYMFVVDATAPGRFSEAREELNLLHKWLDERNCCDPLLIVASKMDNGPDTAALEEISRALDLKGFTRRGRTMALKVNPPCFSHESVDLILIANYRVCLP